jgi:hypothetical protein
VTIATISLPVMVKALEALSMVKDLPIDARLSPEQWRQVRIAHNMLDAQVQPILFATKVEVAMERGPQIAEAMGVRLPVRSMT